MVEVEDINHDHTIECNEVSGNGNEYNCTVNGWTEDGDEVDTRVDGIKKVEMRGESKVGHIKMGGSGRPDFSFDIFGEMDCREQGKSLICGRF